METIEKITSIWDGIVIKRCTDISQLSMDFVNIFTSGPMHQGILGLVRHLLHRLLGRYSKCRAYDASCILSNDVTSIMISAIEKCQTYSQSSWGWSLLTFTNMHQLKDED